MTTKSRVCWASLAACIALCWAISTGFANAGPEGGKPPVGNVDPVSPVNPDLGTGTPTAPPTEPPSLSNQPVLKFVDDGLPVTDFEVYTAVARSEPGGAEGLCGPIVFDTAHTTTTGALTNPAANGPATRLADTITLAPGPRNVCNVTTGWFVTNGDLSPVTLTCEFYTACPSTAAGSACGAAGAGTLIPGSAVSVVATPPANLTLFVVEFPYPNLLVPDTFAVAFSANRDGVAVTICDPVTVGTIPEAPPRLERCGSVAAGTNGCARNFGCDPDNFELTIEVQGVAPTGACCFQDGSCQELTVVQCNDAGGLFQGNDTVCTPNPCPQICTVDCAGTTPEPEACGADTNGGCNSTPDAYTDVVCGDSICGTSWADAGTRDTDWYRVNLPDLDGSGFSELGITLTSSEPTVAFIASGTCGAVVIEATAASVECVPGSAADCLASNATYLIIVVKGTALVGIFDGFPCATPPLGNSEYRLDIECDVCPCVPNTFCCRGDANADGDLNGFDVRFFVAALLNPPDTCGTVEFCRLDCNGDGEINNADIVPFAQAIIGKDCGCSCPDGALDENEACGLNLNGGCNATPPVFSPLEGSPGAGGCGCGTIWATGGTRDTDWWGQIFVPDLDGSGVTEVHLTLTSQIPAVSFLLSNICPPGVLATVDSDDCVSDTVIACVPYNTFYNVFVGTGTAAGGIFDGFPCGGPEGNGYSICVSYDTCPPPCNVDCQGAPPEGETCGLGNDTNGGCNSTPNIYTELGPLTCGTPISRCGIAWADGGTRDTDWYRFSIAAQQFVTVTVRSEFPSAVFLLGGVCGGLTFPATGNGPNDCSPFSISACVPAGTYIVFVGTGNAQGGIFDGIPCGSNRNDYLLTIDCVPCPTGPGNDLCQNATPIVAPSSTPFNTIGAGTEFPDANMCDPYAPPSGGPQSDVFYLYTHTAAAGPVCVSTCGATTMDAMVAVYNPPCASIGANEIICGDDNCGVGGGPARAQWNAVTGSSYIIRLGGWSGGQGTGSINMNLGACPP